MLHVKESTLGTVIIYSMILMTFLWHFLGLGDMLMCEEVTMHKLHSNCVHHKLVFGEFMQLR